jgi:hypothetical protein|tara:strand:- start:13203 stop:13436 length:234 start_codon:yes stop_codon:yes gene_type:complete
MAKYYVQNLNIRQVIDAKSPIHACKKAIRRLGSGKHKLSEHFIVSEKGFPVDREPLVVDNQCDSVIETELVLADLDY